MMELKRWRDVRGIPVTLEPKHFPCDDTAATRLVIAAKLQGALAESLSRSGQFRSPETDTKARH
jgi:2-hydroxychromene-2-carboxylate isomerase